MRHARLWASLVSLLLASACIPMHDPVPDYCREVVKARLVSPATATFALDTEDELLRWQDGRRVVIGVVDSQNRMGALLRTTYRCEVQDNGGALKLLDLDFDWHR